MFRNNAGTAPSVTRAAVQQDIADANERLAQSTIRIVATIDMGGAADPGVALPAGPGISFADGFDCVTVRGAGGLHADETGVFGLKDADANSIDVFYVQNFSAPAIALVGTRGRAYPSLLAGGNALYPNNVIVGSGAAGGGDPHNLAHEIMHILLNAFHRAGEPLTAVFRGNTTLSKAVGGTKRIGPYPDATTAGVGTGDTGTIRGNTEALP